jgi:hypothetical protein
MKKGDTIGITYTGERKVIDLVAEIEKIEDGVVFFWVWNGCWNGRHYPDGKVEAYDGDWLVNTVPGCRIVYCGKHPGGDYGHAIDYINAHLRRNAIERWWLKTTEQVATYVQRFKTACSAFVLAWQGKLAIDKREPFDDDSIPF